MTVLRRKRKQDPTPQELELREGIAAVVRAMTEPDESYRRAAVDHFLQSLPDAALRLVYKALVKALTGSGKTRRRQARASLLQIGLPALSALKLALIQRQSPAQREAAAEVLTALVPFLDREQRRKLLWDAMMVAMSGPLPGEAIARLLAVLRAGERVKP